MSKVFINRFGIPGSDNWSYIFTSPNGAEIHADGKIQREGIMFRAYHPENATKWMFESDVYAITDIALRDGLRNKVAKDLGLKLNVDPDMIEFEQKFSDPSV